VTRARGRRKVVISIYSKEKSKKDSRQGIENVVENRRKEGEERPEGGGSQKEKSIQRRGGIGPKI